MKKLLFPVIALTLILLMVAAVSASAEVIWTIGIDNNSRSDFFPPDPPSETLYTVETSPTTDFPSRLDFNNVRGPKYVEIEFTTPVPYADVSLLYDRWGAETDEVWLDGMSLGTCDGTEVKDSVNYSFDIGVVLPGIYTIKIETIDKSGGDGFHGIDQLQLTGNLLVFVEIDIKPDSVPNSINLKSRGVVPVAVLGDSCFDVNNIDPNTVLFAGAAPVKWVICDVNDDGFDDMLFHFKRRN